MDELNLWWDQLQTLNKVYWIVATSSSLLMIIMFILSMLGQGGEHEINCDTDVDCDCGNLDFASYMLSFKSILAFLVGGSWTGLAALSQGWSNLGVFLTTIGSGALMMVITTLLLVGFLKLQQNSTITMDKTIGCEGEVYLTIPKDGRGQIEIKVNNSYKTYYALSDGEGEIKTHEKIVVVSALDDGTLLVKRQ